MITVGGETYLRIGAKWFQIVGNDPDGDEVRSQVTCVPLCHAMDEIERLRAIVDRLPTPIGPQPQGTWTHDCVQRAFVAGACWWQFHRNRASVFPAERDEMEREAVRRYGEPKARGV